MKLRDNIDDLEHIDDKYLKISKPVAGVTYIVLGVVFLIFGIIGCVEISMAYLVVVIAGPLMCIVFWILTRAALSLCHDVKIIRNKLMADQQQYGYMQAPVQPPVQPPVMPAANPAPPPVLDNEDVKFCSMCGAKNSKTAKFCAHCGKEMH